MKIVRFLGFLGFLLPFVSNAIAASDFQNASQLLAAARRGDIQTVQILVNNGADINYVDATGMSLVCTAVMNNDKRAIQVLQMYGADASKCDRQIKQYKKKTRVAARGEEYGFFSGLSSSHVLALSAVGVVAVIGGVALLTDAFDSKGKNNNGPSGGSHSGSGGGGSGGSSSVNEWGAGAIPIGPAYLASDFDIDTALTNFVTAEATDFNYLRLDQSNNFIDDGLNKDLQNYLLVMRGYYPIVSGYLGQDTFRDSSNVPLLSSTKIDDVSLEGQPARVALITGNGINPAGSADSASGITYVVGVDDTQTVLVDKYLNNARSGNVVTEIKTAFDLSGSGTVFNPFADVNESALAKIVAGWEADERGYGDLYGFVPNAQLAIFRTGNGNMWNDTITQTNVGTLSGDNLTLEVGDQITLNVGDDEYVYTIKNALDTTVTNPTVTVGETTYKLASNSKMFLGACDTTSDCSSDIAIYIGTDGYWYVNSSGGDDIDAVYAVAAGKNSNDEDVNNIYIKKEKESSAFKNFEALKLAINSISALDAIAMVNVLENSRNSYYMPVKDFAVAVSGLADATRAYKYKQLINFYYDYDNYINNTNPTQGGDADFVFSTSMNQSTSLTSTPMIIMPAGDYLAETPIGTKYAPLDATFENYAPLIYSSNLNHNFMTIVAVNNTGGTSDATNVSDYGDGTSSGKLMLSQWADSDGNAYISRKCGLTGTGNGGAVDPWCFAASGPTAEMATAAAAGAVASVKSAFTYMTNDQVFTLLALTAEGPFLKNLTDGTVLAGQDLANYLNDRYEVPMEKQFDDYEPEEYLDLFKDVFGYGLINLERAITPGYTIYYYSNGDIVSSSGNAYWADATTSNSSSVRTSSALSTRGAIKTSFFDIVESADGSMSLPRVWNTQVSLNNDYKHGLYMGDVLAEFDVDSSNKRTNKVGNISFNMSMSPRAYNDNLNGLNDLKIAFSNEHYDIDAQYQRYLTDGESRFNGRANGVLSLVSNGISTGAKYKSGNFAFGAHAFSGTVTDENLLENDPVVSSQYEPARLGFANGGAIDMGYNNDKFGLNISFGNMNETNTVLGAVSDGLLPLNGADTQYVDAVVNYKPFEKIGLSMRATFANTHANLGNGIITELSDIKSNAFAFGADAYGFNFTVAMPLAVVDGKMGYDYADLSVVEKDGKYDIMINNPHTEYIDLSAQKRELRFSGSYKQSIGEFTDAGVGFIYRVNPGNTNAFGNESIFMFKLHHRLGI